MCLETIQFFNFLLNKQLKIVNKSKSEKTYSSLTHSGFTTRGSEEHRCGVIAISFEKWSWSPCTCFDQYLNKVMYVEE